MRLKFYPLILPLLMVVSTSIYGQDESIFNRINGVKLKENIYLKFDEDKKTFRYASDDINSWYDVDNDLIFNLKNDHKNNFKVYVEFYNPLRYSIKSEITDIDDPAYKAINEFISQLPTLPNSQIVEDNKSLLPAASVSKSDGKVSELKQFILIHEWAYQFSQAIDWDTVKVSDKNKDEFGKLLETINDIEEADKYIFGNIYLASIPEYADIKHVYSLNEWIKKRIDILYSADNDYEKFKQNYEISQQVNEGLVESKGKADKSLDETVKLLSSKFDEKIAKFIIASKKEDFKKYSNSTSVWLSMNHIDRFDVNKKAIEKFDAYLKKLKEHIDKFKKKECNKNSECFQYFEDSDIKLSWQSQKMKLFNYEVKKLEKDGTAIAKSNATGEFTVGKRLGLYPFVSTGILYTDFSYPNYTISTDNGVNTVGKALDIKVYVRPSLFLNFLIASWEPVYPFFQVGVTTGVNDAIFPVGLGLTLGKSFSLSGGPMIGYRKDLGSLNIGDFVKDETELKNDLIYKGFVSWYFSINYNIGKK